MHLKPTREQAESVEKRTHFEKKVDMGSEVEVCREGLRSGDISRKGLRVVEKVGGGPVWLPSTSPLAVQLVKHQLLPPSGCRPK